MAKEQIIIDIIKEIKRTTGIICETEPIARCDAYALKLPDERLIYVRYTEDKSVRINVNPDKYKYIVLKLAGNVYVGTLENRNLYCISNKSNGIFIEKDLSVSRKKLNDAGFYASENYDQLIKLVDSIA
ncbi:hypothetical protein [Clostridium sp.]|jgi:hypothetical protein|uniref:hypothetical protein n=1 Tax=Clostridium sp. TaxID=1506 RepID=UPI0025BCA780|nr:hypothetical protein [Clostridium sp.]MCI9069112.1 hypothetical protein [Clostridium sp.]